MRPFQPGANHNEDLNLNTSANDRDNVPDYSDNSGVERKIDRDTALRKLMGTNNVYNPDKISTPVRAEPTSLPTSLAAFIVTGHAAKTNDDHDDAADVEQPDGSKANIRSRKSMTVPWHVFFKTYLFM
jgi:hypothetical protein